MKISLRPHHFLCLQGYKGLNYSKSQANSWSKISKQLEKHPDVDILIIDGSDDLCKKCPAILQSKKSRCINETVKNLDKNVSDILGLVKVKSINIPIS